MTLLLALLVSVALQSADDLHSQVSGLVDRTFPSSDAAKRQEWADRVTNSIQGVTDDSIRAAVLRGLPAAFRYHASFSLQFSGQGSTVPASPEQLEEGYALQADYLQAQVDRISRTPWTPESRRDIEFQIDTLARSAGGLLKERLQGPVAAKLVDDHFEKLREAWRSSLNDPYSRFIDTPLTPQQLDSLIAEMRSKVAELPVIHLTPEDAKDPKRLQKLGMAQALFDVQETAFGACALCFKDLVGPENRVLDWAKKLEDSLSPALPGVHRFPDPKPPGPPAASGPKVVPARQPSQSSQPADRAAVEPPKAPVQVGGDARNPWLWSAIAVVIVVLVLGIGLSLLRRPA